MEDVRESVRAMLIEQIKCLNKQITEGVNAEEIKLLIYAQLALIDVYHKHFGF